MANGRRTRLRITGRRAFLTDVGIAACSPIFAGITVEGTAMGISEAAPKNANRLAGIDYKNLVEEVKARDLRALSDAALYQAAAEIVSRPPRRGATSFTLHAPLEMMARYGLLRLVDPKERDLARLQTIASASVYGGRVDALVLPARMKPFPNLATASAEFSSAFKAGDPDGMETLVLQIAEQFGTSSLVNLLTPLALPTLTGASHSHIGLWLLLRHGEAAIVKDASLLRAAARSIAADPKGQMKSFSGMTISGNQPLKRTPSQIEEEILAKLANPTKGRLGNQSIRGLVEAGEATHNADTLFGEFIRHDLSPAQIGAAFRAVLRVAAHSMLQDDIKHSKFGWTHCLTLPQSACGLASLNTDRKLALAATLVWITAYRSILSQRALNFDWTPDFVKDISLQEALHTSPRAAAARVWHAPETELSDITCALATQAAIRNDIHLVKYTRAVFDMGSFDPEFRRLYLAAAAHLSAIWIQECPRETLLDHLLDGRTTL